MNTQKIHAPWDPATVQELNHFQTSGLMHPFTCGNSHSGAESILLATAEGWICPLECSYTQDWAHQFMADPQVKRELRVLRGTFRDAE